MPNQKLILHDIPPKPFWEFVVFDVNILGVIMILTYISFANQLSSLLKLQYDWLY